MVTVFIYTGNLKSPWGCVAEKTVDCRTVKCETPFAIDFHINTIQHLKKKLSGTLLPV
jgi:hypothetical protein